jgi:hypothetical protein
MGTPSLGAQDPTTTGKEKAVVDGHIDAHHYGELLAADGKISSWVLVDSATVH